jgi:GR25 family glycosyltransferase involved in LPS biosynthesis
MRHHLFTTLATLFLQSHLCAFIQEHETPILKYTKPITVADAKSGIDPIDCVYVINLDARPEKWERTQAQLQERGILANRVSAINGWELTAEQKKELAGPYYVRLEGGPIGCLLSHLSIYKDAWERGYQTIWVAEDDIECVGDVKQIPEYLKKLSEIDPKWDIFYTDMDTRDTQNGYYASRNETGRPDQPLPPIEYFEYREEVADGLMRIRSRFGTTSMIISRRGLEKILAYFSHVYMWTAIDCELHFIRSIREYAPKQEIVSNLRNAPSDTKSYSSLNPEYQR